MNISGVASFGTLSGSPTGRRNKLYELVDNFSHVAGAHAFVYQFTHVPPSPNASTWGAYQAAFRKLVSAVDGIERQATPWPEWAITTVIDTRACWSTVWRAISCHESQVAAYERLRELSADQHEALWGCQSFYRAFSTVNGGRARETDLFEGIRA